MNYVNSKDKGGKCSRHGHASEEIFGELLTKEGYPVAEASLTEQHNHVDFIVNKNNKNIRYEVKARKRVGRGDDNFNDELVWIELLNIIGDGGWIVGGSDYIAFEREKDFVVVDREKLLDLVKEKCNLRKQVYSPEQALYSAYRRRGRKDLLTMIKMSDIEPIANRYIQKEPSTI